MTFSSSEMLGVVSSWIRKDLGASLEKQSSDVFVTELTGERKRIEIFIRRRGSFEVDALIDESLDDDDATVRDGVDDGAVAVEIGDGRIGTSGEEYSTDVGVSIDGGVVERMATVDVCLGHGDTLGETDFDQRDSTCVRCFVQ